MKRIYVPSIKFSVQTNQFLINAFYFDFLLIFFSFYITKIIFFIKKVIHTNTISICYFFNDVIARLVEPFSTLDKKLIERSVFSDNCAKVIYRFILKYLIFLYTDFITTLFAYIRFF